MTEECEVRRVAVVGYGRVGQVLTRAFQAAGYEVVGVVTRSGGPGGGEVRLVRLTAELPSAVDFAVLCLRERQIAEVRDQILSRGGFRDGTVVAHTAGAFSAEVLEPVRACGALPLAWHPLQTFTGHEEPALLKGVTFGIDGDPVAVRIGEEVARRLGGVPFAVPPQLRGVYHLGAVFACNFLAALAAVSVDLLMEIGMDEARASQALDPLLSATLANLHRCGLPAAITGPLRRGDAATVAKHLKILAGKPDAEMAYRALSRILLERLRPVPNEDDLLRILAE